MQTNFLTANLAIACLITGNGQIHSSLAMGCSQCTKPFDWRANPEIEQLTGEPVARKRTRDSKIGRRRSFPAYLSVTSYEIKEKFGKKFVYLVQHYKSSRVNRSLCSGYFCNRVPIFALQRFGLVSCVEPRFQDFSVRHVDHCQTRD